MSTNVSASICPISTPTLKLTILATRPLVAWSNSCSFVARPSPWESPEPAPASRESRAGQQGQAVPQREQADVQQHVLQTIEEEDHPHQKQQMVVARHHVLGAQVHERPDRRAVDRLAEDRIPA